jgi:hypothetical protein
MADELQLKESMRVLVLWDALAVMSLENSVLQLTAFNFTRNRYDPGAKHRQLQNRVFETHNSQSIQEIKEDNPTVMVGPVICLT